jgi:hypothetical protein
MIYRAVTEELPTPGAKTELNARMIKVRPFSYPSQNILGNAMLVEL